MNPILRTDSGELCNDRGEPLVFQNPEEHNPKYCRPFVTVTRKPKWNALYVVHIQGVDSIILEEVGFLTLQVEVLEIRKHVGLFDGPVFIDHTPNPKALEHWASHKSYWVDEMSLEMMVGRWILEGMDYRP